MMLSLFGIGWAWRDCARRGQQRGVLFRRGDACGIPRSLPRPSQRADSVQPLAQIYSGAERPADAFAAVRYRDYWFWIDDRDLYSKRAFTFLMMFSSIAETGIAPQAPIITIPAN